MFHASRIGGSCDFATFFAALPIPSPARVAAVARFLDVSPSSVKLWLSGKRQPPRAAVIALWHESHFGRAVTSAHSEYGATLARQYADTLTGELRAAERTIEALRQELARVKMAAPNGRALAINDPAIDRHRGPV